MSANHNRTDLPVLLLHNLDYAWAPADIAEALREVNKLEMSMRELGHPVTSVPASDADWITRLSDYDPDKYIVFNWCESIPGIPRSEALVAQALARLNFVYTGSTSKVLALSWDKCRVKRLLDHYGVPTPRYRIYESTELNGWSCFPAIVKPAQEHCSFGVTAEAVVLTPEELRERIAYVLRVFHQPALVEDFIDGREFHVSLWGNDTVQMLPPVEMDFAAFDDIHDRLCTFDSKFAPASPHYEQIQLRLPAPLDKAEYRCLEQTALAAYRVLGCRDYARIDIRLRDGIFYVLDVNPNADISSETSTAHAAELAGYSYEAMASYLVSLAALRHPLFGL